MMWQDSLVRFDWSFLCSGHVSDVISFMSFKNTKFSSARSCIWELRCECLVNALKCSMHRKWFVASGKSAFRLVSYSYCSKGNKISSRECGALEIWYFNSLRTMTGVFWACWSVNWALQWVCNEVWKFIGVHFIAVLAILCSMAEANFDVDIMGISDDEAEVLHKCAHKRWLSMRI